MLFPLFVQAGASVPTPAGPPASRAPWAISEKTDAAGHRSASTSVSAADGARLAVRCDRVNDPVVSIQFLPRTRLRSFGVQPVTLQFDGGTPLTDNWELLGGGAIERVDAAVTTLAAGIAHARLIKLRSFDPSGAVVDLAFAGPATEAPIRQVLAACGFTLGQVPARAVPAPAPAPSPAPDPDSAS